ncbi:type III secretion system (T3SS) SseB-like protein [Streptomyces sp. TLI_55]|uniref:SAV_915 family protein n=1 Tax=Streptomyces sp. TLI_55 TaxID=1938861 RepID=UPI000BDD1A34|nr:SAV_915 family protein [Streptomyces sp. TLI_55]SNX63191.1 type III secretion system (T3SS) SseB-like protein [Streptomyces sp. TLI_55]
MTTTLSARNAPEFLVLPTLNEEGVEGAEVALVPVAGDGDGERLVALAFTSVALLVETMGEEQPWVVIPSREMEKALTGSGAVAVLIDPRLADGAEEDHDRG